MGKHGRTIEERLKDRSKRLDNGCLIWTGAADACGYGMLAIDGKTYRTHRLAMSLKEELVEGLDVCHTCDNPACMEISHLWQDTRQANVIDMYQKNRGNGIKGEMVKQSKLKTDDVIEIRVLLGFGFSHRKLGRMYNIGHSTISLIKHRKIWKHL